MKFLYAVVLWFVALMVTLIGVLSVAVNEGCSYVCDWIDTELERIGHTSTR